MMSPKRWKVMALGYSIAVVFLASYATLNLLRAKFKWDDELTRPLIVTISGLLAAPIGLPFIWERLTKVKLLDLEVELSKIIPKIDVSLANVIIEEEAAAEAITSKAEDIQDVLTRLRSAVDQAQQASLVKVDLGNGKRWLSSHLYLLSALAKDFTDVQQLIFVESLENHEESFVGFVAPKDLCNAFAYENPNLETVYHRAFISGHTSYRQPEERIQRIIDQFISPEERLEWMDDWVNQQLLRRWLQKKLIGSCLEIHCEPLSHKPFLFYRIIDRSAPFIALVEGRKLKFIVDRLKLASQVAEKTLRQQLQP